ncbi:MAG TPA: hypothetical protein VGB61_02835 [Pyrinomonadaceae bacterium]|jgi:hypothetical protein
MLRRKVGILFLIGITVLAGTPEAARQFDGLKSTLKNFTRASLWSGLIVYAQPVSDGKLPAPQIYYLMPSPSQPTAPAAQQPLLADNNATTARPEGRNNHGGEVAASNSEPLALVALETARELEDAAKSELALNKLPLNLIASHLVAPHAAPHFAPHVAPHVAPRPDKVRVFEEVARNEAFAARKLKHDADVIVKAFTKELDAAKIITETEHIVAVQAQLERLKSKNFAGVENLHRRMELRVVRRAARPERLDRIKVLAPLAETRGGITLSDISSIGCEKPRTTPEAAPAAPNAPAPSVKTSVARTSVKATNVQAPGEPAFEPALPILPSALGNSWTLNCDTEPEQK